MTLEKLGEKKEAIKMAWELITEVWKLPKDKLWATVYTDDHEAFELWKTETDIDPSHILYFDEKDNFSSTPFLYSVKNKFKLCYETLQAKNKNN